MEFSPKIELFNKPIIIENNYDLSNHKIFEKYTSFLYQKYTFDLLETLCKKSSFENKDKILHKSIYFLLKFLYESKNTILLTNYDIIILISFYLGIKTTENQKKIPNLTQLKNIYKEKFGDYKNEEIKIGEIIIIKQLEYKVNFMTAYDYLCYLFQDNREFIEYPKINLEKIMKEQTKYFCIISPISIIHDCIKNLEKSKLFTYPTIIKKKINQHQKKNQIIFNLTNNIDESLSTSISSGHYNNHHSNDILSHFIGCNKDKVIEKKSPIKNIFSKYVDVSMEKSEEEKKKNYLCCSNKKKKNINITINNSHLDYDKLCDNFTYSKKNIKNLKNNFSKIKNNKKFIYKTNIKEILFQRNNNIPLNIIKYNNTTDRNYNNDISPKNLFSKPYLKKQQSKVCFNSNKKKENGYKYKYLKKFKNLINLDDFKCPLKKKLLIDENDYSLKCPIEY